MCRHFVFPNPFFCHMGRDGRVRGGGGVEPINAVLPCFSSFFCLEFLLLIIVCFVGFFGVVVLFPVYNGQWGDTVGASAVRAQVSMVLELVDL